MLNWAKNSLELVEGTRPRRVNQPAPVIDDTEGLLRKFHPDHSGRKRMVMIGANAGRDFFPVELADMLEADSLLADSFKPGSDIETDVLIIGGGGAGTAQHQPAGGNGGSGGGAGGMVSSYCNPSAAALTLTWGTHAVVVGGGAAATDAQPQPGVQGTPSTFSTITATGGGGGGSGLAGQAGGSGGGTNLNCAAGGAGNTPAIPAALGGPQGFAGSPGVPSSGGGGTGGGGKNKNKDGSFRNDCEARKLHRTLTFRRARLT